jgi:nucleotide-binding universal stress UspA family protein
MKTILLLTDLSDSAAHAARSAVMLCSKLHANLILYNNLFSIPVATFYGAGPWVPDSSSKLEKERNYKLQKLANDIEPLVQHLKPGQFKPSVSFGCSVGSLGENVKELLLQNDIELIVMGASSERTLDHILNGSDTSSVIDNANRPIIVIPPASSFDKIDKITFATDFNDSDVAAINYMARLGTTFKFQLDVVHVDPLDKKGYIHDQKEEDFKYAVDRLNYAGLTYNAIKGRDVVKRLLRLCDESASGMLTVVYYHHSFFVRMLHQSTAKKVLSYQKVPLMIIPSNMNFNK